MIRSKLAEAPEAYGKPLRKVLRNHRSLRIGKYRIVYEVKNRKLLVIVVTVGKRDKVYREAEKRLRSM